jgi:cephamycin C biosynthesis protein
MSLIKSNTGMVWFRDLARLMALDCQVIGVDRNLGLRQVPADEMSGITLHEGDCTASATLEPLRAAAHSLVLIDDAHFDTFNIMKWRLITCLSRATTPSSRT